MKCPGFLKTEVGRSNVHIGLLTIDRMLVAQASPEVQRPVANYELATRRNGGYAKSCLNPKRCGSEGFHLKCHTDAGFVA